jgi:hypothetical protein
LGQIVVNFGTNCKKNCNNNEKIQYSLKKLGIRKINLMLLTVFLSNFWGGVGRGVKPVSFGEG